MNPDHYDQYSDAHFVATFLHEFLHALGLTGHTTVETYPESIMTGIGEQLAVPAIDAAGLRVLLTQLDTVTFQESITVASLGPWSAESVNLKGEVSASDGPLSFGVRHGNGLSVPWDDGALSTTPLAGNPALSGMATWQGELVGFTPSARPVRGNAEVGINIATMNGTADFTELQSWTAGPVPGEIGTGAQWGDGDLNYSITVGGNFLRSTGGDQGAVNGRFLGEAHGGVVGSLERRDLTAAFGATR